MTYTTSRHERASLSRTCKFCARTVVIFVMPSTKQMESRILDLPLPLRPVMELNVSSLQTCQRASFSCARSRHVVYHPDITVRWAYDLKPCGVVSYSFSRCSGGTRRTSIMISVTLMVTDLA